MAKKRMSKGTKKSKGVVKGKSAARKSTSSAKSRSAVIAQNKFKGKNTLKAKGAAKEKSAKAAPKKKAAILWVTALGDRVVIEPLSEGDRTAGGIIIPGTAEEKPQRGRVLSVGSGLRGKKGKLRPLDVQVGDEVLYGKYAGTEVELSGRKLLILKESDIVGILA